MSHLHLSGGGGESLLWPLPHWHRALGTLGITAALLTLCLGLAAFTSRVCYLESKSFEGFPKYSKTNPFKKKKKFFFCISQLCVFAKVPIQLR